MTNIHSYNPQKRLDNILESDKISDQNKQDIKEFHRELEDRKLSKSRRDRYLQTAKQILEYEENDFRLKDATEEQLRKIDRQIDNSAYYSGDYAQETKKEYRKFLRLYAKFSEYGTTEKDVEIPEKASFVKLTVNEDAKDRTNPSKLVKPEDVKHLCRNLPLRYRALLLTHWDLGTRINETLRTRVKDYFKEDGKAYIRVRVNPRQTRDGAKSKRRKARVKIAAPSIDRWLDEGHPDPENPEAYLFSRLKDFKEDEEESELALHPASYSHFGQKLKEAKEEVGLDVDVSTHAIRKARITFLKSLGIEEAQVDKRVGHVPGSRITRVYTRLDDSDSNNAYGEAYGEENPEEKDVQDLVPLSCKDCGVTNPGYRDRCYSCNGLLEIKEVKELKQPVARAREIVWQKLEDEGIAQEIVEKAEIEGT